MLNYKGLTAGIAMLLLSIDLHALSGHPGQYFECEAPEGFAIFQKIQCWTSAQPYIPDDGEWNYPVAFIYPNAPGKNIVKVQMSGHNANPSAFCTGNSYSAPGYVVIKSCAGHYPSHASHAVGGVQPFGWWGYFLGHSNMHRLGLSITKAMAEMSGDGSAGITLEGESYGGTGAILQSMLLRLGDLIWGNRVAVVHANIPHTLFVENFPQRIEGGDQPEIALAWGSEDRDKANFRKMAQQGEIENTYYRVNGSPGDTVVNFSTEFFTICQTYKIACYGTWHNAGHTLAESGINLPFYDKFPGPHSDVRMDRMLIVYTNSSANHWGQQRGHYNLGLEWDLGDNLTDSSSEVIVPLRYRRHTNIGGGVPDQPGSATVDVTLRRVKALNTAPGTTLQWQFGSQSGQITTSKQGEFTIAGLTMPSSEIYTDLVVEPAAAQ